MAVAMILANLLAMLVPFAAGGNCFLPLAKPLPALPINESGVVLMRRYFMANLNIKGTGAIVASPGACPALLACCNTCTGGYAYDWTRDGAISIAALQRLGGSKLAKLGHTDHVTRNYVSDTVKAYAHWVSRRSGREGRARGAVYLEPKWNITTGEPYGGGWCRPQTDGPGLRAMALMQYMREQLRAGAEPWLVEFMRPAFWDIIRSDLDWIIGEGMNKSTCDLWEETKDKDFLWNRMTMRAALMHGHHFALDSGDKERAAHYLHAAKVHLGDPLADHLIEHKKATGVGVLTECRVSGSGLGCRLKRKQIDGSVILSLIHDGWPRMTGLQAQSPVYPTSVTVARTVKRYNEAFCNTYWINREDSAAGVPGILYGRYAMDSYGRGNPWVLISASLATLFYRGARFVVEGGTLHADEVHAWRDALNWSGFEGKVRDFVAAGDAVLMRIAHHAQLDDWHLYEQIHKVSGRQYNARDLTWSYAEVFIALVEREEILDVLQQQEADLPQDKMQHTSDWWV